jgi:hypothetical protein
MQYQHFEETFDEVASFYLKKRKKKRKIESLKPRNLHIDIPEYNLS